MTDVEKQATNIIREWTSLPREHAALLALKLNKAGLLIAPGDDRDTRAQFEAWRRNTAERTKAGSVGVVPDGELRALLGKYNAEHYSGKAKVPDNHIADKETLKRIKAYCHAEYGVSIGQGEIEHAWEGVYYFDGMPTDGIYVTWESADNASAFDYTQFIDVTVDELMRGDD